MTKMADGPFWPCFPARSWEMPLERELPTKLGRIKPPHWISGISYICEKSVDSILRPNSENCGGIFKCYTAEGQFFPMKWGLTLGGRNSALQALYSPWPYIFWTLWTWGITRYHPICAIPMQKMEQTAIKQPYFWVIFGDFWAREPRLYGKISDFQNLSVLSKLLAWHHTVCHRKDP